MTILVTGGNGSVGKTLQTIEKGYIYVKKEDYDLRDKTQVYNCFSKYEPKIVIHLASIVLPGNSNIEEQFNSLLDNTRIHTNVFSACKEFKVEKIITCLSMVMTEKEEGITVEDIERGPSLNINFHEGYSHSKQLLQVLSKLYKKAGYGEVVLLTPVNIFGKFDVYSNRLISTIYNKIKNDEECVHFTLNNKSIRQFIYSFDLANIIIKFTDKKYTSNHYIVGNKDGNEFGEVVDMIQRICSKNKTVTYTDNIFNKTCLTSILPFEFEYTPLYNALEETISSVNI